MRILSAALVLLAAVPASARGQSATSPLSRVDVSASTGVFSADHPVQKECCTWSAGMFKGLRAGFYWTDHLKTELEIAGTGETEAYTFSSSGSPSTSSYRSDHHHYRDLLISGMQSYQFGRNAFFHPFVGAGLDLDREHDDVERITSTGTSIVTTTSSERRLRARPFVAAGFKAYCSERVFFRTDMKAGFRNGLDQVTWKLGFGVDF